MSLIFNCIGSESPRSIFIKSFKEELDSLLPSCLDQRILLLALKKIREKNLEPSNAPVGLQGKVRVMHKMLHNNQNLALTNLMPSEERESVQMDLSLIIQSKINALESETLEEDDQTLGLITETDILKGWGEVLSPHVLDALNMIPENKRTLQARQDVISLFRNLDASTTTQILETIKKTEPSQRSDVIKKSIPFLTETGMDSAWERDDLLQAIYLIPKSQRNAITLQRIFLNREEVTSVQPIEILKSLKKIPESQRAAVIEKVTPLLNNNMWAYLKARLIDFMSNISEDQRESVIENTIPLLQDSSPTSREKERLLKAVSDIPENQRASAIKLATFILLDITWKEPPSRTSILEILLSGLKDQKREDIERVLPRVQNITDGILRACVLKALFLLPKQQRMHFSISKLRALFEESCKQQEEVFKIMEEIPLDQRSVTIERTITFREDSSSFYHLIDPSSFVTLNSYTTPWSSGAFSRYAFETISLLPENARMDFNIDKYMKVFSTAKYENCRRLLKNIPENRRIFGFELLLSENQNLEANEIENLLFPLLSSDLEESKITSTVQKISSILEGLTHDYRKKIYELILLLPLSHIEENAFWLTVTKERKLEDIKELYYCLKTTAPECRSICMRFVCPYNTSYISHFKRFILSHPDQRQATYAYLLQELEACISELNKAKNLSSIILHNYESLLLHEEHPLFQKAIEIRCITDLESTNQSENPYQIYKDLGMKEQLWTGELPSSLIENNRICIDLKGLRSIRQKGFTKANLPNGLSSDGFRNLFTQLEARLVGEEALHIEAEILQSTGLTLEELKENIVNGALFHNLLQIPEDPTQPIQNTTVYLYAILKAILSTKNTREPLELLSDQERALLAFASCLLFCRSGQIDSIVLYYNQLSTEFRITQSEMPSQEKLRLFIESFIQKTLNETFASQELLLSFVEQEQTSQESHQTLYLKNRLHRQVGLQHSLIFDAGTGCILDEIAQASLSDLMNAFFRFFKPEKLVDKLQEEINRSLNDPHANSLMTPLDDFFTNLDRKKEDLLFYDENDHKVKLTRKGALTLLESFHYVQKDKAI